MTRRNRLSPQGRLRCREAGRANLERWKATQADAVSIEDRVEEILSCVVADLGPKPSTAKLVLADSYARTYGVILIASTKAFSGRCKVQRLEGLLDALTRAQGALQRTLKALGARDVHQDDPNAPPGPHATPEQRREWSKRYVEGVFSDERSLKQ